MQTGTDLLTATCWQTQYELTLDLYTCAVESAYLNGDFDEMERLAAIVLSAARTILDKVKIYEIQISAQTAQNQMLKAIEIGRIALSELGIEFPLTPDVARIDAGLKQISDRINGEKIEDLLYLPPNSNLHVLAKMNLLMAFFAAVYMRLPNLLPCISTAIVAVV
ncbi:hypothetical protein [Chamaesiphon sp. VAR_48_metabat_135_sub]|uniref:hypothetical protein n=1 Tax=Chamaesiphon sp. VAR_48_metabat_135_sub TaxID=2964699 RepID=UPI00286C9F9D|nr:hypothetical protein [Chamaesiphon sp. VAR_48_metabat_135_sub]